MDLSKNIFCFYGNEDFLIQKEISILQNKISKQSGSNIEIDKVSSQSMPISEVVNLLCSASLFSPQKIYVLNDFSEDELLLILEKRNSFLNTNFVVIILEKLDRRGSLYKLLSSIAILKEFNTFAEWETQKIEAFILDTAKDFGVAIDPKSAHLLYEISGHSLRVLAKEIEKLATYVGERKKITDEDIKSLAISGELSSFALVNSIANRDIKAAYKSLDYALKAKKPPFYILGEIFSRIRTCLLIKSLKEKKISDAEIVDKLKMNRFFYDKCLSTISKYSLDEFVKAIDVLLKTDIEIKNSSSSPRVALEIALFEIMSRT